MKKITRLRIIVTGLFLFIFMSSFSFSQDFWEKTNGPNGGDVLSMAINSNDDIFVGTSMRNGIFRSTDNGAIWDHILINTGETSFNSFNALAINNQDYVFAGSRGECFRSTDNGDTWKEIKIANNYPDILSIGFNETDEVFAGTENGVYRSSDNGNNWDQVGLANLIINYIQVSDNSNLFAGTQSGIYFSTDNGDNWDQVGLPNNIIYTILITENTHLYAGTDNGVYYSNDNGGNWTQVGLPGLSVCSLLGNSVGDIIAGSKKDGIFRSSDNGLTWIQVNNGIQVPPSTCEASCIAINSLNQIYAGFLHGGVFRSSNNGDNWTKVGLVKGKIKAIAINPVGDIFAGSGIYFWDQFGLGHCSWMMFKSINGGDSWAQIDPVNANINAIAINKESGDIFIGAGVWAMGGYEGWGGVFYSTDNGITWTHKEVGCGHIYDIIIDSNGIIYALTDIEYLSRSIDYGENWEGIASDITALTIGADNHIFAGTINGVFMSADTGNTWTSIGMSDEYVYQIAINSQNHVLAKTQNGLYRSIDNGVNWTNIGFEDISIKKIAINAVGHIFIATDSSGVFHSVDNGDSWNQINSGLTSARVLSLAFDKDGYIYAGTDGDGVYRSSAPVAVEENLLDPNSSRLVMQNYPNPFRTSTTIEYELTKPSSVQLIIYDYLGKQLELIEKKQSQGKQQIIWNAEGLSAGIYFCVIKTKQGTLTTKLIKL